MFIYLCKSHSMDDKEYKELLRRYVNNQCSKEEKERLEALFDFYSKKDEWIEWDEGKQIARNLCT